ncbi:hypothetical protein J2X72_004374 [Phyllobacterium sp. 1468]|nr:hypothetical protein [Phyllobacterium sp. 1468]
MVDGKVLLLEINFFTSPLVNSAANETVEIAVVANAINAHHNWSLLSGTRRSAYTQGLYYSSSCTLITHFTRGVIYISPSFYYTSPQVYVISFTAPG